MRIRSLSQDLVPLPGNVARGAFLIALMILLPCIATAQAPPSALQSVTLARVTVRFDPHLGRPVNHPVEGAPDTPYTITRLLEVSLRPGDPRVLVIDHDPGPSDDDGFVIRLRDHGRLLPLGAKLEGTELTIPGDGYIYVAGQVNDRFFRRRLFALRGTTLREVRQPFYDVNLTAILHSPVTLYQARNGAAVVAHVPAGSTLTVLLAADSQHYLARSPEGIIGWMIGPEPIPELHLHGD